MPLCPVPQPRLVCAEYYASRVVVEATLIRTKYLHDSDDPQGISAYLRTFRTVRVVRGKIGPSFEINEPNTSARTAIEWRDGESYLLFLDYTPEKNENAWGLDGCGNSNLLSKSKNVLAELARIKASSDGGIIEGVVTLPSEFVGFPPTVRVEARRGDESYNTPVHWKEFGGAFRIKVPVGKYVLRAIAPGLSFFPDTDYSSYEDPDNIQIESGGCAQVQFDSKWVSTQQKR